MKIIYTFFLAISIISGGLNQTSKNQSVSNEIIDSKLKSPASTSFNGLGLSSDECNSPLSGSDLDKALNRLTITLPKGWTLITNTPYNTSRSYIENKEGAGLTLQVSAFYTDTTPGNCIKQQADFIVERLKKAKWDVGKFTIFPDEFKIDNKSAAMGMLNGYGYLPGKVPFQTVMLGISSNQTIFVFTFMGTDDNLEDAKQVIKNMGEKFVSIAKTIMIDR